MTWNLLHLARMLKDAGGIPAHGNQRSASGTPAAASTSRTPSTAEHRPRPRWQRYAHGRRRSHGQRAGDGALRHRAVVHDDARGRGGGGPRDRDDPAVEPVGRGPLRVQRGRGHRDAAGGHRGAAAAPQHHAGIARWRRTRRVPAAGRAARRGPGGHPRRPHPVRRGHADRRVARGARPPRRRGDPRRDRHHEAEEALRRAHDVHARLRRHGLPRPAHAAHRGARLRAHAARPRRLRHRGAARAVPRRDRARRRAGRAPRRRPADALEDRLGVRSTPTSSGSRCARSWTRPWTPAGWRPRSSCRRP